MNEYPITIAACYQHYIRSLNTASMWYWWWGCFRFLPLLSCFAHLNQLMIIVLDLWLISVPTVSAEQSLGVIFQCISSQLCWCAKSRCINLTWWLIPLSKWVITPVINGINRVNPLIIGVITHLRFVGSSPPSRIYHQKYCGFQLLQARIVDPDWFTWQMLHRFFADSRTWRRLKLRRVDFLVRKWGSRVALNPLIERHFSKWNFRPRRIPHPGVDGVPKRSPRPKHALQAGISD